MGDCAGEKEGMCARKGLLVASSPELASCRVLAHSAHVEMLGKQKAGKAFLLCQR